MVVCCVSLGQCFACVLDMSQVVLVYAKWNFGLTTSKHTWSWRFRQTKRLSQTTKRRRVWHCRRTEGDWNTKWFDYYGVVVKFGKKGVQWLMKRHNIVLYLSHTSPLPIPNPLYIGYRVLHVHPPPTRQPIFTLFTNVTFNVTFSSPPPTPLFHPGGEHIDCIRYLGLSFLQKTTDLYTLVLTSRDLQSGP